VKVRGVESRTRGVRLCWCLLATCQSLPTCTLIFSRVSYITNDRDAVMLMLIKIVHPCHKRESIREGRVPVYAFGRMDELTPVKRLASLNG
jgi:hypothetical protein